MIQMLLQQKRLIFMIRMKKLLENFLKILL